MIIFVLVVAAVSGYIAEKCPYTVWFVTLLALAGASIIATVLHEHAVALFACLVMHLELNCGPSGFVRPSGTSGPEITWVDET